MLATGLKTGTSARSIQASKDTKPLKDVKDITEANGDVPPSESQQDTLINKKTKSKKSLQAEEQSV